LIASFIAFGIFACQHASVVDQRNHHLLQIGLGELLAQHAKIGNVEHFGTVLVLGFVDEHAVAVSVGALVVFDGFTNLLVFGLAKRNEVHLDHLASAKRDLSSPTLARLLQLLLDVLGHEMGAKAESYHNGKHKKAGPKPRR